MSAEQEGSGQLGPSAAGWLEGTAPLAHVALSSRARLARNIAKCPFVPHAQAEALDITLDKVLKAADRSPALVNFERVSLDNMSIDQRAYLKELRLISQELERGGHARAVLLSSDRKVSIMVNEEDHLRMQCIEPGLQLEKAVARLEAIEAELAAVLPFASSRRFGHLTACPTNVGTGLRASVMLHLPAITITREMENIMAGLTRRGISVRGFQGENSEFLGDFYQISNEVTLGRTVETIMRDLLGIIRNLVEREEETRHKLAKEKGPIVEDAVWRSYALLTYARRIASKEAMMLLSRLRFGIERGFFPALSHETLNRLFIEIQPAHLARTTPPGRGEDPSARDEARALFLRGQLANAQRQ